MKIYQKNEKNVEKTREMTVKIEEFKLRGEYSKCDEIFNEMKKNNFQIDKNNFNNLIECAEIENSFENAEKYYQEMLDQKITINQFIYEKMIKISSNFGDIPKTEKYFNEMIKNGFYPSENSYYNLIRSCVISKNEKKAIEFLGLMKKKKFKVKILILNEMIKISEEDPVKAQFYFNEIIKKGIKPNLRSYQFLINSFIPSGDTDKAKKFYLMMKNDQLIPSIPIFNSLIEVCIQSANIDLALCFYHHFIEIFDHDHNHNNNNINKNNNNRNKKREEEGREVFHSLIRVCEKTGNFNQAKNFYHLMKEKKISANETTFYWLFCVCIKSGNFDQVNDIKKMIFDEEIIKYNLFLYNSLLQICLLKCEEENDRKVYFNGQFDDQFGDQFCDRFDDRVDQLEEAEKIYNEMVKEKVELNLFTFTTIIQICLRSKNIPKAEKYYQEMIDRGISPGQLTLSSLIEIFTKSGDSQKAEKYFKEMINYYNNVIETKIAPNQNAVSSIIDLQTHFLNFLAKRSENVAKISSPPPHLPSPHPLPHLPPPSLSPSSIIQNTKLSDISKTPIKTAISSASSSSSMEIAMQNIGKTSAKIGKSKLKFKFKFGLLKRLKITKFTKFTKLLKNKSFLSAGKALKVLSILGTAMNIFAVYRAYKNAPKDEKLRAASVEIGSIITQSTVVTAFAAIGSYGSPIMGTLIGGLIGVAVNNFFNSIAKFGEEFGALSFDLIKSFLLFVQPLFAYFLPSHSCDHQKNRENNKDYRDNISTCETQRNVKEERK